jgi:Pvc16 N-terminal domain
MVHNRRVIAHALSIVTNELDRHLHTYGGNEPHVELGNVAEVVTGAGNGAAREKLLLSVVNIQEERTLRNVPAYVRDDVALRVRYENPPNFLNLAVLVCAPHPKYPDALSALSRALLFFQHRTVFTQENVHPSSLTKGAPINPLDRLAQFKLIFSLWSPTLEELNDMWGMLGGKQFPFALYSVRMLELSFHATQREAGLITEVRSDFAHKAAVG